MATNGRCLYAGEAPLVITSRERVVAVRSLWRLLVRGGRGGARGDRYWRGEGHGEERYWRGEGVICRMNSVFVT